MATLATSVSPSVLRAIKDANARWPTRLRKLANGTRPGVASDGTLPSEAHLKASPKSRHNDGSAFDLTHDPESGCEGDVIAKLALQDPRTEEIIWDRRIWTRHREAEGWRPYGGQNPHTSHIHITTYLASRDNVSPWPWSPEYVSIYDEDTGKDLQESAKNVGKAFLIFAGIFAAIRLLTGCAVVERAVTEYPQAFVETELGAAEAYKEHAEACDLLKAFDKPAGAACQERRKKAYERLSRGIEWGYRITLCTLQGDMQCLTKP